jgi:hypothetical protein
MTPRLCFRAVPFALAVCAAGSLSAAQETKTLKGTVTIKSTARTVAVHGTTGADRDAFLFCIDSTSTAALPSIDFRGAAEVVYRPLEAADVPAGVTISGPESVANALTVIPAAGQAWVFVGPREEALLPSGAAALTNVKKVDVQLVRRTDWAAAQGPRRGTDIEGCLAPGG